MIDIIIYLVVVIVNIVLIIMMWSTRINHIKSLDYNTSKLMKEVNEAVEREKEFRRLAKELGVKLPEYHYYTTTYQPQASSGFPIYLAAAMVSF